MEILMYASYIAIIGVLCLFIAQKIKKLFRWSESNHTEMKTVEATLVKKEEKSTYRSNGYQRSKGAIPVSASINTVTFETADKEKLSFSVRAFDCGTLNEGDTGTLKYQGTYFVSFRKNESSE